MKKRILLISYWVNKIGNSPGIMADDKIDSLLKQNYKIVVLSSYDCLKINKENVSHFRVPSISLSDFFYESKNISGLSEFFLFLILLPLALTLGLFLNISEYVLLKGKSGGKWFWFILAFPLAIILILIYKINVIFSTGGPSCAHLVGIILTFFSKNKFFSELQDPLYGKDIGRSSRSAKYLKLFEKILLKRCHKLVFVTKLAAEESKKRNNLFKHKIHGIYSGSIKQNLNNIYTKNKYNVKNKTVLTHLGTLYSSRNLKNLIKAIKNLSNRNLISLSKIKILNLGDIYGQELKEDCKNFYVEWIKSTNRKQALQKCYESDFLLLIQHTDDRSKLTFPYKIYEYLNLGLPIFALLNNHELKEMLSRRGHICANINDYKEIGAKLLFLIKYKKKISQNISKLELKYKITHSHQCKKIFET